MKLFFETGTQVRTFLLMIPIGFLSSFCMEIGRRKGWIRFCLDLIIMVMSAIAMVSFSLHVHEPLLRLYHLLGLSTGALLYAGGVGKVLRALKAPVSSKAGIQHDSSEKEYTSD